MVTNSTFRPFSFLIKRLLGVVIGGTVNGEEVHACDIMIDPPNLTVKTLSGAEARPYAKQIALLRTQSFKEFPYLYEGSWEYEKNYLELYFGSPNSRILLLMKDEEVVGFSSALPLNEEMEEIQQPFLRENHDLSHYLYIGEGILLPPYRGKGFLRQWGESHLTYAQEGGYKHLVFMTVDRAPNHPLRPYNYKDLEPLWEHFGFSCLKDMKVTVSWKQIDTHKEETNFLSIWRRTITP